MPGSVEDDALAARAAAARRLSTRAATARRLSTRLLDLPPARRSRSVFKIYGDAGGSLLAEGLAYGALFAGLTGLLFSFGLLGYFVPSDADRRQILGLFNGQLAPLEPIAKAGLESVAAHAAAFSLAGLAGMAWGASHFYGSLDQAVARVFARTPARGTLDRILRGLVSVVLLVGGLLSGIGIAAIQAVASPYIPTGAEGDAIRAVASVAFPVTTALVVVAAVAVVYRVVPNTTVPLRVLRLPALVAGLALTLLTELLVYIAPLLAGALSVFGGVAAVFVALAWLHLAFQVVMIGAAWTRLRLDEAATRAAAAPGSPRSGS